MADTTQAVRIGQIWADNDKRYWADDLTPTRFLRVEDLVEKKRPTRDGYSWRTEKVPAARVVAVEMDSLSNQWVVKCRPGKNPSYRTIILERFRPNATGYRLWEDRTDG